MCQKKRSFLREDILKIFSYNSVLPHPNLGIIRLLLPLSSIAGMSHTICLDEEGPGARLTFRQKKCIFSVDSRGFNFSI